MDSISLLQGIFLTQESNRGLLHCRWILYQLNYQGIPMDCLIRICYKTMTTNMNVTQATNFFFPINVYLLPFVF